MNTAKDTTGWFTPQRKRQLGLAVLSVAIPSRFATEVETWPAQIETEPDTTEETEESEAAE